MHGKGTFHRQTHRQTDGHVDSLTNSAQRAELVKSLWFQLYICISKTILTHD